MECDPKTAIQRNRKEEKKEKGEKEKPSPFLSQWKNRHRQTSVGEAIKE